MDFSLVFLVALALAGTANAAPAEKSNELLDIVAEFKNLYPEDALDELSLFYLFTDEEFQNAVNFVRSSEFRDLVQQINKIDDLINLYDYLEEAGLDVYSVVNGLHDNLDLPHLVSKNRSKRDEHEMKITGGTAGYITDVRAILPVDKVKALHEEKLKTSPAFARFVDYLKAPRFQELIDALSANEQFQNLLATAKNAGIDVKALANLELDVLGIKLPERQ